MDRNPLDWTNISFLAGVHLAAAAAVGYLAFHPPAAASIVLAIGLYVLCGLGITAGYHRLFAHPTYRATAPVRALLLFAGAGAVQNSALKWSADHRAHHACTDSDRDPYNIRRGLWWAHMGWVFRADHFVPLHRVRDLAQDPLVRWQDRHYVLLAVLATLGVPLALGWLWGDPIGALLLGGIVRLVLQWHATFAINSLAHRFGSRPYQRESSARDSAWLALPTLGEGYHNFHHRFPNDYRNGHRRFDLDPTKWFVWALSRVGLVSDLRRTDPERIVAARAAAQD